MAKSHCLCCWLVPLVQVYISISQTGQTPLHLAALYGKLEVVKHLVNAKGDANVQDSKSGKTALHYAIEKGDSGINITGYLLMMQVCVCVCVCVCVDDKALPFPGAISGLGDNSNRMAANSRQ